MKQLILFICTTFVLVQANAQDQRRSFFITASGGATLDRQDQGNKSSSIQLSTSFNYLLNKKWAISLIAEHTRGTATAGRVSVPLSSNAGFITVNSSYKAKQQSWFVGPQARYYYALTEKLSIFGEAQAGLRFESHETESSTSSYYTGGIIYNSATDILISRNDNMNEGETMSLAATASPGIVYFLKPRLGLELKTNLLHYRQDLDNSMLPDGAEQAKNFTADFSLSSSRIGVNFYF